MRHPRRQLVPACALATLSVLSLPGRALAQLAEPAPPRRALCFEPTLEDGEYFARASGVSWRMRGGTLCASRGATDTTLQLVGADANARLEPGERLPGVSHYYLGNDPTAWRTDVPHFGALRVRGVLPGVDLVHRAAGGDLEFDVVLAPGADPEGLCLRVAGGRPRRTADGALAIRRDDGELRLAVPFVYQEVRGERRRVACEYVVDGHDVRFALGDHDPALALTIDPVATFSTMLGGSMGQESVKGVKLDMQGNLLVTGTTQAPNFPLANNLPVAWRNDIGFVTKFDANGVLVFSTFFGGTTGLVTPVDIGADPNGQIVVGGNTTCPDLPTTAGVVQPALVGGGDWFFVDLLAGGTLGWCTYYGGPGAQLGMRCLEVLDVALGSVLAVGNEGQFPFMTSAYSQVGGLVCAGIFGGNVLWASTACGFSGTPTAVDVTDQGHICITGTVLSGSGLPTTGASLQPNPAAPGGIDGFVFVFGGSANSLVFATYFGGTSSDQPRAIHATTGPGTVVVTIAGNTSSTDLPIANAIQAAKGSGQDGFVAQIDGLTQTLVFSTYLGGADGGEVVSGVGRDAAGHVVVAGHGNSADLPFANPLKLPNGFSNRDVVLWRLLPTGALDFCTNYGGNGSEVLVDLSVAASGAFAIAGTTQTNSWPSTVNGLVPAFADQDAFVVSFDARSLESYGSGTPGYFGFVPVLAGGGPQAIGTTTLLQIHDGRAQSIGVLGAGLGRIDVPLWGGSILVYPLVLQTIVLNGSTATTPSTYGGGWLHTSFAIPNIPSAVGTVIDFQAALFDVAANSGVALTNGVELVVQ